MSIKDAEKNGVFVQTFDGPITAMIIGDPMSGEGWAQLEAYLPWTEAHGRPSIFLRQRDYPECFKLLLGVFESMWERKPSPSILKAEIEVLTRECREIEIRRKGAMAESMRNEIEVTKLKDKVESYRNHIQELGRWRISACGRTFTNLDLTVSIQFETTEEKQLARTLYNLFWSDFPGSPWKTEQISPLSPYRENPSERARIVIFSRHEISAGIKAALNEHELLPPGEEVDRRNQDVEMLADITIIVFRGR